MNTRNHHAKICVGACLALLLLPAVQAVSGPVPGKEARFRKMQDEVRKMGNQHAQLEGEDPQLVAAEPPTEDRSRLIKPGGNEDFTCDGRIIPIVAKPGVYWGTSGSRPSGTWTYVSKDFGGKVYPIEVVDPSQPCSVLQDSRLLSTVKKVACELKGAGMVVVHSAYRSPSHNTKVGGKPQSFHMRCLAMDFSVRAGKYIERIPQGPEREISNHAVQVSAFMHQQKTAGVGVGGLGLYKEFTHVDLGPGRQFFGASYDQCQATVIKAKKKPANCR